MWTTSYPRHLIPLYSETSFVPYLRSVTWLILENYTIFLVLPFKSKKVVCSFLNPNMQKIYCLVLTCQVANQLVHRWRLVPNFVLIPKLFFPEGSLFRSLAGALQYVTITHPDISYAIQQVCLFMHAPREPHFQLLKRILRYIKGTISQGLVISPSPSIKLTAYSDADWGGCLDSRRSTSGYCVYMGPNINSWSSKRQPTISRSSAEAEYRGSPTS